MIITKMALPRRTFLRGMGVTLALPLLDAMVPALTAMAQTAARPVRRLGCYYHPNGFIAQEWVPSVVGSGYELSPSLKALAAVQDRIHKRSKGRFYRDRFSRDAGRRSSTLLVVILVVLTLAAAALALQNLVVIEDAPAAPPPPPAHGPEP